MARGKGRRGGTRVFFFLHMLIRVREREDASS